MCSSRSRLNVSRILLLGPESCSVCGEGFEPCLSFNIDVGQYTLELSDSVSNILLNFDVACFRQFFTLPGEMFFDLGFFIIDTRELREIIPQLISHSSHCLYEPSKLSFGLGDPRSVDWPIFNCRPGGLDPFYAPTCAVGYAGEVLKFTVCKVRTARKDFICLPERLYSEATQTFS